MSKIMKKGERTAKGIEKNIIKNNIKHEDYKNTLINNEQMHHKMKTIRSQRHQLGSYEISKVSLSCFDDKRYIHDNGTSSYANTQNITIGTNPFIKHIGLHTSGQDIDSLYFCKISASILLEQDIDSLYFCKISASILLEQDITIFHDPLKCLTL